jgi:hypothetical protein
MSTLRARNIPDTTTPRKDRRMPPNRRKLRAVADTQLTSSQVSSSEESSRRSGPRYATPGEVEAVTSQWSNAVLECRDMGHHWQRSDVAHVARDRYYRISDTCGRCDVTRYREMSERGHIYATTYAYPEGYLIEGLGRIAGDGKDVIRLASVLRDSHTREIRSAKNTPEPRFGVTRREIGE